jgi:predicted RecA/RadA family phage recombinase
MSVLTENYDAQGKAGALVSYPVAGSTHIYKGSLVCVNSEGYAVPGADSADYAFVGVAYEETNNTSGSAGDRRVRLLKTGSFVYSKEDAGQSDLGKLMYLSDDNTVADSTDHSVPAGIVVEVPNSSQVRLRIDTQVK